ncbi:MAG: ABC transporter permease subunit [Burkholderiales bacterium]|nr:ABC transporter permease subunit [Burkholderiales bacterium]
MGDEIMRVGSKRFTESYILGEIIAQSVPGGAEHRPGLGNTGIVYAALKAGSIDLYPEYTGTIAREILKLEGAFTLDDLKRGLAPEGLGVAVRLGFNNTYALAMLEQQAERLSLGKLSDLARHPDLKLGLSQEFIARSDGWAALKSGYALPQTPVGLEHGLAYEAIAARQIDVMDIYSTDAKIERYGLRLLEDDRGVFPRYDAVLVYRLDLPQRLPQAWKALQQLEGRISEQQMIRLNAAAELEHKGFAETAKAFLAGSGARAAPARSFIAALFGGNFWRLTREHLLLVFASLAAGIVVAVPLGVLAARIEVAAQPILGAVGVIQTIPSLALLAFLIPLLGSIGTAPALIALFLYMLLPIARNTHAGMQGVGRGMREAAMALGLAPADRLLLIELPLAAPSILAGIKTSAVIGVGTATIAAFIGAGGYGERIVQGLALNDNTTLLAGAIPAAALALIIQASFELIERAAFPLLRRGA